MRLYFFRHGVAEDTDMDRPDQLRQLTREGIARTKATARILLAAGVKPRRLYSSPLARARQTADIVAQILDAKVTVRRALAPGFDLDAIAPLIAGLRGTDEVMFVGHEPDFSAVISQIIGGGEIIMKKGGVARVDIGSATPPHGALVWLLAPKLIETERL
jgi:phosphohistidine phosphatase